MRHFFFLILFSLASYSQVTKVEYTFYKNLGYPVTQNWTLVFNNYESYFYKTNSDTKENNANQDKVLNNKHSKDNSFSHNINFKLDALSFYHLDFNKDSLYFQANVLEDLYIVNEQIPKLKWNIVDEFKIIDNYKCQKATTSFRGRSYKAWFTTEIPTQTGPWKVNGLPGLILNLVDENSQVVLSALKVNFYPALDLKKEVEFIVPKGKPISLKDFVPLSDNEIDEIIKRSRSKSNRNYTSSFIKSKTRHSLEISYEWEQEEEEED